MAFTTTVGSHFGTLPLLVTDPGFATISTSFSWVQFQSSNISADYVVGTGFDLTALDYTNGGAYNLQLGDNCPFGGIYQGCFVPNTYALRGVYVGVFVYKNFVNPLKCYLQLFSTLGLTPTEIVPGTDVLNGDLINVILKFVQEV